MRKPTVKDIQRAARDRKPGYVDAVLSVAKREGDTLTITDEQAAKIRADYGKSQQQLALEAQARGEIYNPTGKCTEC